MAKFVIGTNPNLATPAIIESYNTGERYGITIDEFVGGVDNNGAMISVNNMPSITFTGVRTIGASRLSYAFCHKNFVTSELISFPNLTTINGNRACYHAFDNITNPGTGAVATNGIVDMSNLVSISGTSACEGMFYQAKKIKEFRFTNLTSISGSYACREMFYECPHFTSISFPSLTTVYNTNAFTDMFVYTNVTAIHFKASARSAIEALDFYSSKWGASSATIYFDL